MRVELGHDELHIAAGFVEEVPERRSRDNVGARWSAAFDGGANVVQTAVLAKLLSIVSDHYS